MKATTNITQKTTEASRPTVGRFVTAGIWGAVLLACVGQERAGSAPQLMNELGSTRSGRVVLHALCVVKHPDRLRWHWRGIVREFVSSSRAATTASPI